MEALYDNAAQLALHGVCIGRHRCSHVHMDTVCMLSHGYAQSIGHSHPVKTGSQPMYQVLCVQQRMTSSGSLAG